MNKSKQIRAQLGAMKVGEKIEFVGVPHSLVYYAMKSHCRNEIMREILDFTVTSKGDVVTVERNHVDLG